MKPLQSSQPITQKGDLPSPDMVIIVQQLVRKVRDLEKRVEALE